jgi:hypothetical protein
MASASSILDRYPDTRGLGEAKGTFHSDVKFSRRDITQKHVAFHGTVKIHGCNITILFRPSMAPQYQSRDRVITPEEDCYGAAAFLCTRIQTIKGVLQTVVPSGNGKEVMIAGEWAG